MNEGVQRLLRTLGIRGVKKSSGRRYPVVAKRVCALPSTKNDAFFQHDLVLFHFTRVNHPKGPLLPRYLAIVCNLYGKLIDDVCAISSLFLRSTVLNGLST